MDTVKIGNKGQITIPAKLRKKLGLETGVELRIFSTKAGDGFKAAPTGSIKDLAGSLPKPPRAFTIDEINEGIELAAVEENSSS